MCAACEEWMFDATFDYMVKCDVPLEIALRLVRDTVVQNTIGDMVGEEAWKSAVDLSRYVEKVAERLRDLPPTVIAAVVELRRE